MLLLRPRRCFAAAANACAAAANTTTTTAAAACTTTTGIHRRLSTAPSSPSPAAPSVPPTPPGSATAAAGTGAERPPLLDHLEMLINFRGPMTVAEFMNIALLHPQHGYYCQENDDVFGRTGDFTTAPEISQLFGEMVGIWCVATWQQLGCPSNLRLVEIGPGRGTLASDVLRVAGQFPAFAAALEALHLVERSPSLRRVQQGTLGCVQPDGKEGEEEEEEEETGDDDDTDSLTARMVLPLPGADAEGGGGVPVHWHDMVTNVPDDGPCIMLAQELFDALPVHQFEYTEQGWCERLVDVLREEEEEEEEEGNDKGADDVSGSGGEEAGAEADDADPLQFVLSPAPTNASRVYIRMFGANLSLPPADDDGDDAAVDDSPAADTSDGGQVDDAQIGARLEVSPAGSALAQDMALRVASHGGAALVVDYGRDRASGDSLRGIRDHRFVSPLREPGRVDLSIDVDFSSLRAAVHALKLGGLQVHGTVGQGEFLKALGIETRLAALLQADDTTEEQAEALFLAYKRLTEADEMGSIYRAMAMVAPVPAAGPADQSEEEEEEEEGVLLGPPAGF